MRSFMENVGLQLGQRLPLMLQTEATECGLACLAMVAHYHGYRSDLASLRRRFAISLKGVTLAGLMDVAQRMELSSRAVRLELEGLELLSMPCILHWNFNHFVVLKAVGSNGVTILDPAVGVRRLSMSEASKAFTGVALELWPSSEFKPRQEKQRVQLHRLMGRVTGLARSLGQIVLLALALEMFAVVSPFFLQWTVDNVLVTADRDLLTTLGLGFGLLVIVQQLVALARSWIILYLGTTLNVQWRANVFTHLLRVCRKFCV